VSLSTPIFPARHGGPCRAVWRALCLALVVATAGGALLAQQYPKNLVYQPRGNRAEGLAAAPKTDSSVVLVSALADVSPHSPITEWPQNLRLRFFYPPGERPPVLRVRQLRSNTGYYVMDSVTPSAPWATGAVNSFAWGTSIASQVYDFQVPAAQREKTSKSAWLSGLGVVVTLGTGGAAGQLQRLTVAPAAFEHSDGPLSVANYLFSFRTNEAAVVSGSIVNANDKPVLSGLNYSVTAGSPFTVRWTAAGSPDGWYRLVLDVSFAGQQPQVAVRFYHKRALPAGG
jgi:hypothetical protein